MPSPKVSVCCYYKDEARFLKPMIESVLDQTHENFELVLLDNGSTDASRSIAHSFSDRRIRFLDFDEDIAGEDLDFAHENNVATQACTGDLIAIVGGDDLLHPDRLAVQVSAFEADPLLDVCHSAAKHIDAQGNLLSTHFTAHPYHAWNLLRIAYTYLQIAYPTCMIRRSSLETVGGFEGGYCPDYWLWLKTARTWRFRYLGEPLLWYRIHDRSASHSPGGSAKCAAATVKVRAEARAMYAIEDFFPEIALCEDQDKARCAAHLELGNMMLSGGCANIQLAFDEYKKADELWGDHPALIYNAGVIMALDGQTEAAMKAFEKLPESPMLSAAKAISQGLMRRPFTMSDGRGISEELYRVKPPAGTWKSDGTFF